MPRALWANAPLALLHHRVGLLAVCGAAFLVAVGAAAGPLMNAGAESETLQSKLRVMTPLGAGLVVDRPISIDRGSLRLADERRRAAAASLARTLPSVGRPVVATTTFAELSGPSLVIGNPNIVLMARTEATAHVHKLSGPGGAGVWLSRAVAGAGAVRTGRRVTFVPSFPASRGAGRVSLPLAAVYQPLDSDLSNPYWVNYTVRIRAPGPDAPLPPTFALVSPSQIYRLADKVGARALANVYEFPLQTQGMTPGRAKRIARAFQQVARTLATPSTLAKRLGCADALPCHVSSELTDAVAIASSANSSLRPVVDLLAGFCVLIALSAALLTGVFTGRRRAAEARLSLVGGEPPSSFLARAAIEALLPSIAGAAAGFALTVELVRVFTPDGAVDASVFRQAGARVAVSVVASALAVAFGLTLARGRLGARRAGRRRLARLPWETVAIAGAVASWLLLLTGNGLVKDTVAGSHPRLVVLVLPALVAAPAAGLLARALRSFVLRRSAASIVAVFLALRRVAAARGLIVTLIVAVAVGIASLSFAEILQRSLAANNTEKALVNNGSDVQGLIDPAQSLPRSFPYPITKVQEWFDAGLTDSGRSFEVIAVDPPSLARVLAPRWAHAVRSAVQKLADSDAPLPAVAVGLGTGTHAVTIEGTRAHVQVVARVRAFPGMLPSQVVLVIPSRQLPAAPATAFTYVWSTGSVRRVEAALSSLSPTPSYLTTVSDFSRSPDVQNITRTYGFLRIIALAIVGLALVALMLYLSSRQRSQLVTSAFLRRMGVTQADQAWSAALESIVLAGVAAAVGVGAALLTAGVIVGHVDPLSQYPPAATAVLPWWPLVVSGGGTILVSGLIGAGVSLVVRRSDVGEDLRVT